MSLLIIPMNDVLLIRLTLLRLLNNSNQGCPGRGPFLMRSLDLGDRDWTGTRVARNLVFFQLDFMDLGTNRVFLRSIEHDLKSRFLVIQRLCTKIRVV